jgi:hypothetical protein
MPSDLDLTILMPCLNEAETLERCIVKARASLDRLGVPGEVLIADNGSTDGSQAIAERCGARVVPVKEKGYGSALRGGIEAARGRWIVMGDADDSYDFSSIDGFVDRLKQGFDLVMGCRLPSGGGTVAPGAMPWKNRWIGNPSLSFLGRLFFRTPVKDFHCGLRGFSKEAYDRMDLRTTGMEFASEMVIKATLKGMKVAETPITLHKDGRSRPPHLKPWRDGWRHLRFMLIYCPRWLFLVPGLGLAAVSAALVGALSCGPIEVGSVRFDIGTLSVAAVGLLLGVQAVAFAFFTKVFAIGEGLLPPDRKFNGLFRVFTLERGIIGGVLAVLAGVALVMQATFVWGGAGFGDLAPDENLRRLIPGGTLIALGFQAIWSSFLMSLLGLRMRDRHPPTLDETES